MLLFVLNFIAKHKCRANLDKNLCLVIYIVYLIEKPSKYTFIPIFGFFWMYINYKKKINIFNGFSSSQLQIEVDCICFAFNRLCHYKVLEDDDTNINQHQY